MEIEKAKLNLNSTKSEQTAPYWHIVFFKDIQNKWSWLLSKPTLTEVDITKWKK